MPSAHLPHPCTGWGRQYDVIKLNVYYGIANNIWSNTMLVAGMPTPTHWNYDFFLLVCRPGFSKNIFNKKKRKKKNHSVQLKRSDLRIYEKCVHKHKFKSNENVIFCVGNHSERCQLYCFPSEIVLALPASALAKWIWSTGRHRHIQRSVRQARMATNTKRR